ncbi:hypothetical protein CALCODRAFT_483928 [Calocera cornea HHB12733]|uniref:Uncharacterized protein n=1 Tax=Calocera cornea HHB12733 TaxID=1353952 RepID=A0A165FA10_9BASI|nr:hypothetical protein CALCODRAFT_483928 [Calocera cornea HHB12733]
MDLEWKGSRILSAALVQHLKTHFASSACLPYEIGSLPYADSQDNYWQDDDWLLGSDLVVMETEVEDWPRGDVSLIRNGFGFDQALVLLAATGDGTCKETVWSVKESKPTKYLALRVNEDFEDDQIDARYTLRQSLVSARDAVCELYQPADPKRVKAIHPDAVFRLDAIKRDLEQLLEVPQMDGKGQVVAKEILSRLGVEIVVAQTD